MIANEDGHDQRQEVELEQKGSDWAEKLSVVKAELAEEPIEEVLYWRK